ncbi:hypothetical protein, partial [Escherichia sp. MOD1-EC6096]|uniref:hypothetical protein n=1 Tax=Escherichia sp. MOD1-EC6096 TaxID=2093882 RepID=UPI001F39AAD5
AMPRNSESAPGCFLPHLSSESIFLTHHAKLCFALFVFKISALKLFYVANFEFFSYTQHCNGA